MALLPKRGVDFVEGAGVKVTDARGIAKSMIEMAAALGCKVLLACSSTSRHASGKRTN